MTEHFCIFVTEEGGTYRAHRCTPREYNIWKSNRLIFHQGDRDPRTEAPYTWEPSFMALARVEDNFDFVLGSSLDEDGPVTVPTDPAAFNPLGLVRSSRKCLTCDNRIWWSHYPGRPEEFESGHDRCTLCEPW